MAAKLTYTKVQEYLISLVPEREPEMMVMENTAMRRVFRSSVPPQVMYVIKQRA